MARRHVHYEAAFEDYVRSRGWPYLPVDEQRKAIFSGARIKSFDFLVYPPEQKAWLVDIKGRKFPYEVNGTKRYWENWVTRDDLEGLGRWKGVFGEDFEPLLVFVYWLRSSALSTPLPELHMFRGEYYAFLAISASDYAAYCRERSPKWDTVSLPVNRFRDLARPMPAFS
jgi:hypothetical protein